MTSHCTIGVHVPSDTSFTAKIVDHLNNDFRNPYYTLHLDDIYFYITPAQLTSLADSLAQYQSPVLSFGERAMAAALSAAA